MIDVPTLQGWLGIPSSQDVALLTMLESAVVAAFHSITDRYFGPPAPQIEVLDGTGQPNLYLREVPLAPGTYPSGPVPPASGSPTTVAATALTASWRQTMSDAPQSFVAPDVYGLPSVPGDYEVWGRKLVAATSMASVIPLGDVGGIGYLTRWTGWPPGRKNLIFQYFAGYSPGAEPLDVRLAITALVGIFYSRRGDMALLQRESDGNVSRGYVGVAIGGVPTESPLRRFIKQFPEIMLTVDTWRRHSFGGRL